MHIHTHNFTCFTSRLNQCYLRNAPSKIIASARKPFPGSVGKLDFKRNRILFQRMNSELVSLVAGKRNRRGAIHSVSEGQSSSTDMETKRKVVEHICLLKAKEDLSDEDEKDMLDFLYTSQYQMGGIVAISLGRISHQSLESYTHAVFMRFQKREDLAKFYEKPFYLRVIKDHVTPYCHEMTCVDYESEVDDDILPIFRKGEEFNFGVELILLIGFAESSLGGTAEDALASFAKLSTEFPSLIVQATQGSNFNSSSKDYTHGVVIRFRSSEAFEIFMGSSEYKDMWRSKFQPITEMVLSVSFSVDPIGTEMIIPREVIHALCCSALQGLACRWVI